MPEQNEVLLRRPVPKEVLDQMRRETLASFPELGKVLDSDTSDKSDSE